MIAHQFLFQYASGSLGSRETYAKQVRDAARNAESAAFAMELIDGCIEKWGDLTAAIERVAQNWSLDRMNASDLNVLRLATYELLYRTDIPHQVTLNEAVELAKRFGTKESGAFVNGILDKIAKSDDVGNGTE